MSKANPAIWLRFIAPAILLLALVLAALPVLEVGLQGTPQNFESWNKMREHSGRPKAAVDGTLVLMTQNGYQSIWAGYSWGAEIAEEKAQEGNVSREQKRKNREQIERNRKAFEDMAKAKGATVTRTRAQRPGPAVLMIFYFLFLIGAAVVGCSLPSGKLRAIIFCGTTAAAAACLALQMVIGFPFANTTHPQVKGMQVGIDGAFRAGPPGSNGDEGKTKVFAHNLPWPHLTWLVLLGAMIVACLDLVIVHDRQPARRSRPDDEPPRTSRRARDEPRKQRRARVESDEDERPPRTRRS